MSFLEQSLNPSVFWNAISAIGTLIGILIALLFPMYSQFKKNNHIELVLLAEVKQNYQLVKKISNKNMPSPVPNQVIAAFQMNGALISHMKLSLWSQLKYELATNRPISFKKFNDINQSIEEMHSTMLQHEKLRSEMQNDIAKKFISKYKDSFTK